MNPSPFADDWRNCLEAHFLDRVAHGDKVALDTVTRLYAKLGYSSNEINRMIVAGALQYGNIPVKDLQEAIKQRDE